MKKQLSVPVQLSLKLTAAITLFLSFLFMFFTWVMFKNLYRLKSRNLDRANAVITRFLDRNSVLFLDSAVSSGFIELPYYVNYTVYDMTTKSVYATNNYYIPLLSVTDGKTLRYIEKDFYLDGNLDVLYSTSFVPSRNLCIQTSIDVENDSSSKLIFTFPLALPYVILPIILITYIILYSFIEKTFNREHDFSANVSHELQTPVNAILGHANLLNRWGKEDPEQLDKSLKVIINEAHSMKATIKNLLDMTKLEKKLVNLTITEFSVYEFFDSIREEFSQENDIQIQIANESDFPPVSFSTDRERLHQIFLVAISNSMKFCEKPCVITLSQAEEGKKMIFEIQDNGKGFSKEILPHIFDRFYRGDEAHSRSKGGAGLGLSIAKSIVLSLDGKISAHNAKEGGAVIRLEFPKK